MARRLQDTERTVAELRQALDTVTGSQGVQQSQPFSELQDGHCVSTIPDTSQSETNIHPCHNEEPPENQGSADESVSESRLLTDLSLDEYGKVGFQDCSMCSFHLLVSAMLLWAYLFSSCASVDGVAV